jgi:hypothetical protein
VIGLGNRGSQIGTACQDETHIAAGEVFQFIIGNRTRRRDDEKTGWDQINVGRGGELGHLQSLGIGFSCLALKHRHQQPHI